MNSCTANFTLYSVNCTGGLITIGEDNKITYLTACDEITEKWQIPLMIATAILLGLFALSSLSICILHKIQDPIAMLQISRRYYPMKCFECIWPESQFDPIEKSLLGPILHFIINPCKETLVESNEKLVNRTKNDMMHWSIKYGYRELIRTMLSPKVGEIVTHKLITKALLEGDTKVIEIIMIETKGQKNTLDLDHDNIVKLLYQLHRVRGKYF